MTLEEEIKECKVNELILIGNFLLNKFEEEPELEDKYNKSNMTLNKLFDEISKEVKKEYAKNRNSCFVEDKVVYGIALHIIDESKEIEKSDVKIVAKNPLKKKKAKPTKSIDEIEMKFIDDIKLEEDSNTDLKEEQLTLL